MAVQISPIQHSLQVHRFLIQVATDNIALTGLNFFPVTRTVLLTVSNNEKRYIEIKKKFVILSPPE
jgi:hypothetical protein